MAPPVIDDDGKNLVRCAVFDRGLEGRPTSIERIKPTVTDHMVRHLLIVRGLIRHERGDGGLDNQDIRARCLNDWQKIDAGLPGGEKNFRDVFRCRHHGVVAGVKFNPAPIGQVFDTGKSILNTEFKAGPHTANVGFRQIGPIVTG